MRLHRFFVSREIGKDKEVVIHDTALFHQLKNVFRFTTGGQVVLLDNTGYEYHSLISSFGYGDIKFSIVSKRESKNIPTREIYLFCSLIKKDKFEWVLEKGTELGVTKFIPLISDRSEKKSFDIERARKILRESAEQSEKALIPTVSETLSFEDSINQEFPCFAFDPKGETFNIEHAQNFSPLGIFIGPEGGWTDRETFLFKKKGIKVYSLGHSILRAETAAVAISTLLLLG
jgi:16S rRNA (uracil1498-N3)-methyltransferase